LVVASFVFAALMHCGSSYTDSPGSGDGGGAASSSSGGTSTSSGNGGSTSSSGSTPTDAGTDAPARPPGMIACALTTTICDSTQAQCCDAVSGTDTAAARTWNGNSTSCMAIGGPNCGAFVGVGDDFTMKFPQRCEKTSDCATDQACCVLADGTDRFGKQLTEISCQAKDQCNTKGRVLCTSKADCLATENCLPETDPVLSHVYTSFCR
jgi:hypothetical protein